TVPELFDESGSGVNELAFAVKLMTVPPGVLALTLTTIMNSTLCPAGSTSPWQVIVPVPPTGGVVQLQSDPLMDWNVVFAGTDAESVGPEALSGPLFPKLIVYVILSPALTGSGVPPISR